MEVIGLNCKIVLRRRTCVIPILIRYALIEVRVRFKRFDPGGLLQSLSVEMFKRLKMVIRFLAIASFVFFLSTVLGDYRAHL